jgi:hypothetical protein
MQAFSSLHNDHQSIYVPYASCIGRVHLRRHTLTRHQPSNPLWNEFFSKDCPCGAGPVPTDAECHVQILEAAKKLKQAGWEYEMHASFIEVYNDTLRDLLADGKGRDGRLLDGNSIKHGAEGQQPC